MCKLLVLRRKCIYKLWNNEKQLFHFLDKQNTETIILESCLVYYISLYKVGYKTTTSRCNRNKIFKFLLLKYI